MSRLDEVWNRLVLAGYTVASVQFLIDEEGVDGFNPGREYGYHDGSACRQAALEVSNKSGKYAGVNNYVLL